MSKIQIEAQPRERTKKLRPMIDEGFVPAVIYDQQGKSDNIKIAANVVEKLLQDLIGTPIVHINLGKKTLITLLRETQMDLRRNVVNHLSFLALDPKKTADFDVDISLSGESSAVKNSLGVLIAGSDSVQLRGLPENIPPHIEADISVLLKVGDKIVISDLSIPDTLELVHEGDENLVVATIQPFQKTLEEEREEEKLLKAKDEEAGAEDEDIDDEEATSDEETKEKDDTGETGETEEKETSAEE